MTNDISDERSVFAAVTDLTLIQLPLRLVSDQAPVLRQSARELTADELSSSALLRVIDGMWALLDSIPHGIGLAAPQVGLGLRIFLASYGQTRLTAINPKLVRMDMLERIEQWEGCLSLPGYQARVRRSAEVTIKGFDTKGNPLLLTGRGNLARIFTHELDHLDGRLYIDRMLPGSFEVLSPTAIEANRSITRSGEKQNAKSSASLFSTARPTKRGQNEGVS